MHALIILLLLVLVSGETISLKNDGNVVNGIKRRVIKAEELHNFLRNKKIGGGNNLFQENFLRELLCKFDRNLNNVQWTRHGLNSMRAHRVSSILCHRYLRFSNLLFATR